MQITRLHTNDLEDHKGRVIAAIESDERQDGQRVFYVVLERFTGATGMTYRTQRVHWYPQEVDETTTKWTMEFHEGHGDWIGADGREKAMRDMLYRAYSRPEEDEKTPEVQVGTYRLTDYYGADLIADVRIDADGFMWLFETDITREGSDDSKDTRIGLSVSERAKLVEVLTGQAIPGLLNPDGTITHVYPHCKHCGLTDTMHADKWHGGETLTPDLSGHYNPCASCQAEGVAAHQTVQT